MKKNHLTSIIQYEKILEEILERRDVFDVIEDYRTNI